MKTLSISASILLAWLVGMLTNESWVTNGSGPSVESRRSVKLVSGYYSGSYPASSGYHNYGWYSIDASGIPNLSYVTISFNAHDVPNRFYLVDDCGMGTWTYSGASSPYNWWVGQASYSGPWNFSGGISTATSGNISLQKMNNCNSYKFQVETSTGSTITDYWDVTY